MKKLAVAVVFFAASNVVAAEYSDDDLCRAIGETPRVALQPRDRLFFEKKCTCLNIADPSATSPDISMCVATGSDLHKAAQRRADEAWKKKQDVLARRRAEADRHRQEENAARAQKRQEKAAAEKRRQAAMDGREAKRPALEAAFKTACQAHQDCVEKKAPDCTTATMPAFKAACADAEKVGFSPFACRFPENEACLW